MRKHSFSEKVTLKVIILGIRMCSAGLLLWKNQKGSTDLLAHDFI